MARSSTLLVASTMILAASQGLAQPKCPGDFNGDVQVTVDEIVGSVTHALEGCPVRFVDNGDGTITDNWTRLMWEKKSDDGDIHDQDNYYTWSASANSDGLCDNQDNSQDGSAFTEFLATLNQQDFAGHNDWRMPTVQELLAIVDYARLVPAIDPAFDNCEPGCGVAQCSCTALISYWSSTTAVGFSGATAWVVDYNSGRTGDAIGKCSPLPVRAVR